MARTVKPTWELFDQLVLSAHEELLICAPWISTAGIQRLNALLLSDDHPRARIKRVQILARISDANTDSRGLLLLAQNLRKAGIVILLGDSPILHAKVYIADRCTAMVGSANLTSAGFRHHLELAVLMNETQELLSLMAEMKDVISRSDPVSLENLETFVLTQLPAILEAQSQMPQALETLPVWRQSDLGVHAVQRESSGGIDLTGTLLPRVIASIEATTHSLNKLDLAQWVDRKAMVWTCPCYVTSGNLSQELVRLAAPYNSGQLKPDELLRPEMFTKLTGRIEQLFDGKRASFRKYRTRGARIMLTRYPDPGDPSWFYSSEFDPCFLLGISDA